MKYISIAALAVILCATSLASMSEEMEFLRITYTPGYSECTLKQALHRDSDSPLSLFQVKGKISDYGCKALISNEDFYSRYKFCAIAKERSHARHTTLTITPSGECGIRPLGDYVIFYAEAEEGGFINNCMFTCLTKN